LTIFTCSVSVEAIVQKFGKIRTGKPVSDPADSGRGRKPGREFLKPRQESPTTGYFFVCCKNANCHLCFLL